MVGYAICGSFCTHKKALEVLKKFVDSGIEILPILSENSYNTSTRFGKAEDFIKTIEDMTKKKIIHSIKDSEPIGPNRNLEALIIAPCTGNTLAKMAHGITDTFDTLLYERINLNYANFIEVMADINLPLLNYS